MAVYKRAGLQRAIPSVLTKVNATEDAGVDTRLLVEDTEEPPTTTTESEVIQNAILPSLGTIWGFWPLLKNSTLNTWAAVLKNRMIAIPVSALLITVLLVFSMMSEYVFGSAAHVAVTEYELLNVTKTGVFVAMKGTINMDYSQIDWFLKMIFIPITFIMGKLVITPIETVYVFTKWAQHPNESFHNPARFWFPEVVVDLTPGSMNWFEIPLEVHINPLALGQIYSQFMEMKDLQQIPDIKLLIAFQSKLHVKKLIPLGAVSTTVQREILFKAAASSIFPTYTRFKSNIGCTDDSIVMKSTGWLERFPIPMTTTIGPIEWEVYIQSCDTKSILPLAIVNTDTMDIENGQRTKVGANLIVPTFAKELERFCHDGFSPINKLIKTLRERDHASVFVKAAAKTPINDQLPSWLYLLLTNVIQPVRLTSSDFSAIAPLEKEWEMQSASVMIPNNPSVHAQLNLSFLLSIMFVFQNDHNELIDVTKIFGDICFTYHGRILIKIYLHSWQEVQTIGDSSVTLFDVNLTNAMLHIVEGELLGNLIMRYLGGEKLTIRRISKLDLDIRTPVSSRILQQVEYNEWLALSANRGAFDRFNMILVNFTVASSPVTDELRIFVELALHTPLPFTLGMQFLSVDIQYGGIVIGRAEFTEFELKQDELSRLTPLIILRADSAQKNYAIRALMSSWISGNEPVIVLHGHNESCKLPQVAGMISGLSIPVALPVYQREKSDVSGLFLGAEFHVTTSSVELTVVNPFSLKAVLLTINEASVFSKDLFVARITSTQESILLQPGITVTRKIPVEVQNGTAWQLLKDSVNGQIPLRTIAIVGLTIGNFTVNNLAYDGPEVYFQIRM